MSFALAPIIASMSGATSSGGLGSFIGTALGGLASGIKSLFSSGSAYGVAQDIYNVYQQNKQNERTENLQNQLWERDDTAMTRLMKQYTDNGVNPLLAVPNVSQGNTKGFETSALHSDYDYETHKIAREQYNLNKERQELELKIMSDQNDRAREKAKNERTKENIENAILRAKLNGAKAYAKVYGSGLGLDFGDDGYIPPYAQNEVEKLLSAGLSLLSNSKVDFSQNPFERYVGTGKVTIPQEVLNDPDIKQPHSILKPTQLKYHGTTFEYVPEKDAYEYNGQLYKNVDLVKYRIDYANKHKQQDNFDNYLLDESYYTPMYLTQ